MKPSRKLGWAVGCMVGLGLAAVLIAVCSIIVSVRAPAAGGAEAYYRWLMGCMDEIEQDVPEIVRSAEAAARVHVDGGAIGVSGEVGFVNEGLGRCGGLMSAASARPDMRIRLTGLVDAAAYSGARPGAAGPKAARDSDGWIEIGFGTGRVLEQALAGGAPFDFVVENHAAEHNGLFPAGDGTWVVPTVQNANVVALWVWTGEFVAACTRLGKMPLMFQGFTFPGGRERALKLAGPTAVKYSGPGTENFFHDEPPQPVGAGVAGRMYLREVRAILKRVRRREMAGIRRAAAVAAQAKEQGRDIYLVAEWHAFNSMQKRPCNASYVSYGPQPKAGANVFRAGDVVLCVGYAEVRKEYAEAARAAGATFMSSFSSCLEGRGMPERPGREYLRPDELFIDQHWPFGDAVVQFPGYDIKILPPSGVIGEAVIQMFTSELHTILTAQENGQQST